MLKFARDLILLIALVVARPASSAPAAGGLCRTLASSGQEVVACTVDRRRYQVRLFWKGPDGQAYGSFDRLRDGAGRSALVLAMNAGMYHPDLSPVGLYVEQGQQLKEASTASGPGNFHLKPNGIFFVKGQEAGVIETSRYLQRKLRPEFATQSGPMLVMHGRIHPRISEQGTSRKIRNGVGVRDRHTIVLAISTEPVTFHEFSRLFRDEHGCPNALFPDGSVSSLYAPELERKDILHPIGPIIGVLPR